MAYTPTNWSDEVPNTTPVKYNIKTSGGTPIYTDVQIEVNTTVTPGTPLNAANLNKIENGVALVNNAPPLGFTALGQLMVGTGAGAGVMLPVGSNGYVLQADTGQATGLKWEQAVSAIVKQDTAQSIPTGAATIIAYSVEDWDSHNAFTTGASANYNVALRPGIYSFAGLVVFASASWVGATQLYVDLYINGSYSRRLSYYEVFSTLSGVTLSMIFSGMVKLSNNDYIDFRLYQNSGGARALSTADKNWLNIARIK